jgi:hypothetical protein
MGNPKPNIKGLKPIKPGEVRNPKGKPKGAMNSKTIIRRFLELDAVATNPNTKKKVALKGLKGEPITYMEAIIIRMIQRAMKGDTTAFNAILDRMEGKPKQTTDITLPTGAVVMIGGQKVDDK